MPGKECHFVTNFSERKKPKRYVVIANQRRNAGVAPSGHNPFPCLPLGEGGSRVPRKRETDEGKKLSVKTCVCDHPLHKCFGSGSSGGNVLVPARTLRRSRLKGRCRKAAPLRIPRPHRRKCLKMFLAAMGDVIGSFRKRPGGCDRWEGVTPKHSRSLKF